MGKTFEEERELINLKHQQKLQIIEFDRATMIAEHQMKMERLNKLLEIAVAGGGKIKNVASEEEAGEEAEKKEDDDK